MIALLIASDIDHNQRLFKKNYNSARTMLNFFMVFDFRCDYIRPSSRTRKSATPLEIDNLNSSICCRVLFEKKRTN
jgi:hypothetical protein